MKEKLDSYRLIAISGVKGSGKNECSSMLQYCLSVPKIFRQYWFYKHFRKLIKPKYKILAFADPLKRMLSVLLNVPFDEFNSRGFKEFGMVKMDTLDVYFSPGFLTRISDSKFNKLVKQLDSELSTADLSIRQLMQYFGTEISRKFLGENVWINSTLKHCNTPTIISDLRFINEYEAVKSKGGFCIYVNRSGYGFGQHASELEMRELFEENQYNYIIENSGTLKDLFNEIKKLCNDDF